MRNILKEVQNHAISVKIRVRTEEAAEIGITESLESLTWLVLGLIILPRCPHEEKRYCIPLVEITVGSLRQ